MYESFKLVKDGRDFLGLADYFDEEIHCNLPWRVNLNLGTEPNTVLISLMCYHHVNSDMWSIRVKGTCHLEADGIKVQMPIQCEDGSLFEFKYKQRSWKGLMNVPTKPLVFAKNIRIVFDVKILYTYGIHLEIPYELTFDDPDHSDVVLVVEDRKFYVHKGTLGRFSPVFHAMFRPEAGWVESKRNAIVQIVGANPESFETFLKCLYMYGKVDVNEQNVVDLLELAHKYDVQILTPQCEKFLVNEESMGIEEKAQLANHYGLSALDEEVKWLRREAAEEAQAAAEGVVIEKPEVSMFGSRYDRVMRRLCMDDEDPEE